MPKKQDKHMITAAITGAVHTPSMSPYLPITQEQIAVGAIDAAKAGATAVHIHVRNPETGEPTHDIDLFREVLGRIHGESDVVICPSGGGSIFMSPEERIKVVEIFEPEMASLNMGSFNFGLFTIAEKYNELQYDWERKYLESSRDHVFANTFKTLEFFFSTFKEHGTKPEMECYDLGHLYTVAHFAEKQMIEPPFYMQFIFGILGGMQSNIENLLHMKREADRLFGQDYMFSVLSAGRNQYAMCTASVLMGGNARTGMEDSLHLGKGELAKSNADMVSKMRRIFNELSLDTASPEEARKLLRLKGRNGVKY